MSNSSNNIYNILSTLKSLEPTPEQTTKAIAQRIYESVEAQGSIIAGVAGVEARLRQQFAESDFSDTSKAIQKSGKSKASADAITASIGRKKLGQAEMTRRSVAGKKHAHEGVAEGQLDEATYRDVIYSLLDKFYADMKMPPRQNSHSGELEIKPPGTRVWTRLDGTRHRDPGYITASYFASDKKQAEKLATKFWPWLLKQPGVKSIGQVSGQFGSSPMKDAVAYKGLYFTDGQYGVQFGSLSRIKNPKSVWRHQPPATPQPQDDQGVAENIGGVGAFAVLQHAKNLNKQPQPTAPTKKQSYTPRHDDHEETMGSDDNYDDEMVEGTGQQLSIEQLATISDEALDNAYHYGRSQPGNTFGWQANLKSAAYAKQMIDKGVTDIEAISDAIHKGWNVTAQAFVKNPQMFDDSKTMAPEKLQAKIAQRQKLMTQQYAQLPEDEKEKDRVVARAMLQAITGGQQEVGEDMEPEDLGTVAEINRLIAKGMHETDAIHAVAKKYGDNPSELASFYYQHNMHEGTVHKGTYGTSYDPSDEEKRDKPKREIKHGQKGRPRAEKPMDSKSAPKGDIFGRTTGEVPKGKRGTKIKGHGNIDESTSYQKQNFMFESFNFANMMKETDQTVQEMLTELQGDIATFKMTGECSPKLDAFLRVHGHSKKQLADEAKVTPNYEVPAVQRKAAGEPALSLGDVQAHDANRSMHPGMTKLDAPKPANIHDELDELAELAGITKVTDEGNAFTGKLASTAHGDDFELDGKHYTDTSKLDEAMCNECGMYESQCSCTEGNLFTKYLKDTPKGGEFEIDGKHYTDTSNLDEASMKLEDMARLAGIAVEGRDYGDTSFKEPHVFDNTPDEVVYGEDVLLKGGDGEVAGMEKSMHPDKPTFKNGDNALAKAPMESREVDPIEAMGRKLMKQYESIKIQK